ncbi:beta-galactosidase [Agrobacterium larrymoorei]|uniref:Beta-galactosidase n=1 Tax=Agrobacterium larrymoorei TaxID=160699 RepID=A0A4D7E5C2_9HYPH|nr:beta-galactosidase [Agrobacterium larrymoorei]QCJ00381.1 beta-galactosidase [Agrobacterium larrymoorei]QYA09174.1 beta-galactosidase [Agrobacterium larrymoorei]
MLGVCYYPEHWDESRWADDARRMRELGISFVRIGEFAWSRIEPSRDTFDFGWLDRAMDVLAGAGLKIVLGTPTATPPKWLVDENPDILPYDEHGKVRGFGSRRHYTFSSETWWRESARIVEIIAKRYGEHPGLVGWQTDNEYGCHDTILSWGPEDLKAFKRWLRLRYQSATQLNEAWGSVFWSMEVNSFDEVALPNLTVTEPNPATRLDFWRFHSDQVAAYDKMQCDTIRLHSPDRWITHNFMGFVSDFDHFKVAENLDLASWDSYPIGFVEKFPFTEEERNRWAETSHPDIAPYHHDLYRGVGRGRFWVMEQQPGPVNWAPWNPVPKPGMVRLWTWEALAHGAEVVSYFRWRQASFAQEQMHAGLNIAGLDELSPGGLEAQQVGEELMAMTLPEGGKAHVALVFDYQSYWTTMIQPQGKDFRYEELCFRWYEGLRRLGLDVDFVRPGASLDGYQLVVVPCMTEVCASTEAALRNAKGTILIGARTGSRDRNFVIPKNLPPGPLGDKTGNRVIQVSTLRPGLSDTVTGAISGAAIRWRETVQTSADVLARFGNGDPALTEKDNMLYLACWADEALLSSVLALAADKAKLKTMPLPATIRIRRRGNMVFAFNYGTEAWTLPEGAEPVLGSSELQPQQVAAWIETAA